MVRRISSISIDRYAGESSDTPYPVLKSVHQVFTKRPELIGLGGKRSEVGKRGAA